MSAYDSDGSDGGDYTETNVLLGYAQKEPGDDTITHLGGTPQWINEKTAPNAALARCKACKDIMVLLLQLDANLPDRFPGHERRLFVFACRKTKCRRKDGSIRVLRSVRVAKDAPPMTVERAEGKEEKKEEEKKKPVVTNKVVTSSGLGESLFGAKGIGGVNPFGGANPFAKGGAAPVGGNLFMASRKNNGEEEAKGVEKLPATFAEKLAINNPLAEKPKVTLEAKELWPTTGLAKSYPTLYMDAEYETLDPEEEMKIPSHAKIERMEIEDETAAGSSSKDGKEDQNAFESIMDATFQKFADRLSQNPEQVIRYEFGGEPLVYSDTDAVGQLLIAEEGQKVKGIPRCGKCGAGRKFEVQVTPYAITELEADDLSLDGMDWGTIIVGVCGMDCQEEGVETEEVGYVEEWVGVQWEELNQK